MKSILCRTLLVSLMFIGFMNVAQAQLRAGAARVEITPPLVSTTGRVNPEAASQGPTGKYDHEHLYVRAIVVDNGKTRATLMNVETNHLSENMWDIAAKKIAEDLNCPTANVLFSATHTHSPGVPVGGSNPGKPLEPQEQRIVDALVKAAHDAKANLQPARMKFGTGTAYLNSSRDAIDPVSHKWTQAPNLAAPSDKTVAVLDFETPKGEPIGVYVNYAMHAINGYIAGFASGDFPGAMCRWVEKNYGDKAVVIFSQGASGDQNPLYLHLATDALAARSGVPITGNDMVKEPIEAPLREDKVEAKPLDPQVRDRLESWMQAEGQLIGEEVIRVISNTTRTADNVRIWGTDKVVTCPGRKRTDQGREGMAGTYEDAAPVPLRLGVIGIGDVALTHINAEVYNVIGQRVKRQSPMANTVFVTIADGRAPSGYIPDDVSYSHLSFQVLGSRLKPGCAEDTISDTLTDLIEQYINSQPQS